MAARLHHIRILRRATICILIGILFTYATAWLAICFENDAALRLLDAQPPSRLRGHFGESPLPVELRGIGFRERQWIGFSPRQDTVLGVTAGHLRAGLPIHAVESFVGETYPAGTAFPTPSALPQRQDLNLGLLARGIPRRNRSIDAWLQIGVDFQTFGYPLRPLWTGFAINTATYATLTWLLFRAITWICARHRSRHTRCPTCAYDIRDLPTCPECGTVQETRQSQHAIQA
jgi:hypothetical protein